MAARNQYRRGSALGG
ncbi:MAG: hypothetical protein ACO3SL_10350 [Vulcanococcus sp.]